MVGVDGDVNGLIVLMGRAKKELPPAGKVRLSPFSGFILRSSGIYVLYVYHLGLM
jgi:hypothetical protein